MNDSLDTFPLKPIPLRSYYSELPIRFTVGKKRDLHVLVGMDRGFSAPDGYTCFSLILGGGFLGSGWTYQEKDKTGVMYSSGSYPQAIVEKSLEPRLGVLGAPVLASKLQTAAEALVEEIQRAFPHYGDLLDGEVQVVNHWLAAHALDLPVRHPQPQNDFNPHEVSRDYDNFLKSFRES